MKPVAWLMALAPLLLAAPEDTALGLEARGVAFGKTPFTVTFELVNGGQKPVKAFVLAIHAVEVSPGLAPRPYTWEDTSEVEWDPLPPGGRRAREYHFKPWGPKAVYNQPSVEVRGVIFSDNSAAGDLEVLDDKVARARKRNEAMRGFLIDFQKALSAADVASAYTELRKDVMRSLSDEQEAARPDYTAVKDEISREFYLVEKVMQAQGASPAAILSAIVEKLRPPAALIARRAEMFSGTGMNYHVRTPTVRTNRKIEIRTPGFRLIEAAENEGVLVLTMQNAYFKTIVAYATRIGTLEKRDVPGNYWGLMPDETGWIKVPVAGAPGSAVTVVCVIFEDGSGDGEPAKIREIQERRQGRLMELSRMRPLVEQALARADAELPAALRQLIAGITALPEAPAASADIRAGMQEARSYVLTDLERLSGLVPKSRELRLRSALPMGWGYYVQELSKY